ncbi:Phosphatidylglycerophosphatase and protein-tyrosine phosphatase 1 [Podila epicladia]|nr:Phosphatidylglycerophosphatase and protein-tyrosine phosphatase 1 [Podila epicladia]
MASENDHEQSLEHGSNIDQSTTTYNGPYNGDGVDPLQPTELPQRTPADWVAYTVSLNYNRVCLHLLESLQKQEKVENILNMCAEFRGHLEKMRELGLYQCWVPTRDFHTPSVPDIWICVRLIAKCEKQWQELPEQERGTIYLHCKAGRGRSATIALCWLVYQFKLSTLEAQAILLHARGQVDKDIHRHTEVITFYSQTSRKEVKHVSFFVPELEAGNKKLTDEASEEYRKDQECKEETECEA